MAGGFVKLRRDLPDWIINDERKLKWYIDLLLLSEDRDSKKTVAGRVRMTMRQLSKRWGVDTKSVSRFLHLLDDGNLILLYIKKCDTMPQKMSQEVSQIYILSSSDLREQMSQKVSQMVSQETDVVETPVEVKQKGSLVTPARKVFENHYNALFNEFYYWQPKDAANMKQLLDKIKSSRSMKNMPVDDESILYAFTKLLEMIDDEFILKNFSVSIINNKYNNIVSSIHAKTRIKNGN